jgi:hypothetical protein
MRAKALLLIPLLLGAACWPIDETWWPPPGHGSGADAGLQGPDGGGKGDVASLEIGDGALLETQPDRDEPSDILPSGSLGRWPALVGLDVDAQGRHVNGTAHFREGTDDFLVRFSSSAHEGGHTTASFEDDDRRIDVVVESDENSWIEWRGARLPPRGSLTTGQEVLLSDLVRDRMRWAVVQIPLQLGCRVPREGFSDQLTALLLPWQMMIKHYPETVDPSEAEQNGVCKYLSLSKAGPRSVLLQREFPFPYVYGRYLIDMNGRRDATASFLSVVDDSFHGRCRTSCRGACGDGCSGARCDQTGSVKERDCGPDGDVQIANIQTYECSTHEGCRVHDQCYDSCNEQFGCSQLLSKGSFDCHRDCDQGCLSRFHDSCKYWALGLDSTDAEHAPTRRVYREVTEVLRLPCPPGKTCRIENGEPSCECGVTCADGQPPTSDTCTCCQAGEKSCGNSCSDVSRDSLNCGECSHRCGGHEICQSGRCACEAGFEICADTRACVPVCAVPKVRQSFCSCSCPEMSCPLGSTKNLETCVCECPADQVACSGKCVDLSAEQAHCGRCGLACVENYECLGGTCVCPDGLLPAHDGCRCPFPANTAGQVCVGGRVCTVEGCQCPPTWEFAQGACRPPCPAGTARCGPGCLAHECETSNDCALHQICSIRSGAECQGPRYCRDMCPPSEVACLFPFSIGCFKPDLVPPNQTCGRDGPT